MEPEAVGSFVQSNGIAGLLAAIAVSTSLHLMMKIGEFLWTVKEKKDAVTESGIEKLSAAMQHNTLASEKLETRIKTLEGTLHDITKFKIDLRRLFTAVKIIAGEDWPDIRKEIMDEAAL